MRLLQTLPRSVLHVNPSRPVPIVPKHPERPVPVLIDPKQVDYHILVIVESERLANHFEDRLAATPQAAALTP